MEDNTLRRYISQLDAILLAMAGVMGVFIMLLVGAPNIFIYTFIAGIAAMMTLVMLREYYFGGDNG